MNICTIIAKNYVAHARVLAESFNEHHPDGTCFALIIDEFTPEQIDPAHEPFEVVRPSDLTLSAADFDDMRARYSVLEFSTAVKPWLLRHMLDAHDDGSGIAYFDPDIRVYARMEELEQALRESSIVLTPHLTKPLPRDGMKPSETDIMIAGIYNLGFIGLSRGSDADALIEFWEERLRTDCWVAPERGLFVDQKWIDWVPGLLTDLTILREPAYNVAYWNVPTREVSRNGTGYRVDDRPLRFFHFSGYSPDRPALFSKHQDRISLVPGTPLKQLCDGYGERLLANRFEEVRTFPYGHDSFPSGEPIDTYSRALYRQGIDSGAITTSIFTPNGEIDFVVWLNQDTKEAPGLTRYLREIWQQRADLQRAYADVTDTDLEGYLGWCAAFGRKEIPIAARFLAHLEPLEVEVETSNTVELRASAVEADEPLPTRSITLPREFGVNVAGYLRSELGIAEVARQMVRALDTVGVPSLPRSLTAPGSRQGHPFVAANDHDGPFPVNLIFVNADGLPDFAEEVGDSYFEGRHSIGFWWWELPTFPEAYHGAFDLVDEVWVGSEFVAQALRQHASIPVVHMPVPIETPMPPPLASGEFGWPQDAFTFYFSWDYNSVFARKNPLALIEAYTSAFAPGDGAALVLKCINGDHDALNHNVLRGAIADRPDIVLIDQYVPARDKDRLMATCDCYVSLHRSEGLGLTMAEAMLFGKPLIATYYSGNTDFMSADNSYPVKFEITKVGPGAAPYDADSSWAEPDTVHAAALMREVFDDREGSAARAERGAQTIRDRYSSRAVGEAIALRLQRFQHTGEDLEVPSALPIPDDTVDTLVARGSTPRAPSNFGKPGAALRKLLLRLLKPYTAYQADVNRGLLERTERTEPLAQQLTADIARLELQMSEDLGTVLAELRLQRGAIEATIEAVSQETRVRSIEIADLQRLHLGNGSATSDED